MHYEYTDLTKQIHSLFACFGLTNNQCVKISLAHSDHQLLIPLWKQSTLK